MRTAQPLVRAQYYYNLTAQAIRLLYTTKYVDKSGWVQVAFTLKNLLKKLVYKISKHNFFSHNEGKEFDMNIIIVP